MKRAFAVLVVLIVIGAVGYFWLNRSDDSEGQAPLLAGAPAAAAVLVRGEYLTKAADCVACHTAPEGGRPYAGGLPFVLPFGTIYSSNISPDEETGIGRWTDDEFVRAMQHGIRNDGKRLYPAFPYTSYTLLSRTDVLAIKAYLFSLPKISQPNRPLGIGFPFNQRWAMGFWNALFFKDERFVSDKTKSAQWNSGAYLATALGHCAECHTPRNLGFGLEHSNELAGAPIEGWRAYNITSDKVHGIGAWSDADVASYLSTGHADGRGSASGSMGDAVEKSLQYLKADDMTAVVDYLRSVPARSGKDPITIDAKPVAALTANASAPAGNDPSGNPQGLALFEGACASCHQWNGQGQQVAHAALIGARGVNDPEGTNVAQVILHGAQRRIAGVDVFMPDFEHAYTDTEVAALSNYVIAHFGNKKGEVTPHAVAELRKQK
jgi:mono/diheme cytochrome c family protein